MTDKKHTPIPIEEWIEKNFDNNKAECARSQGVSRATVHNWINRGDVVINGMLYSRDRVLNK